MSTGLLLASVSMWLAGAALAYLSKWYITPTAWVDALVIFLVAVPVVTSALAGVAAIGFFVFLRRNQFVAELLAAVVFFAILWLTLGGG